MSIYVVTVTKRSDSAPYMGYPTSCERITTKMASSYDDAVAYAVEFYLKEYNDRETFLYNGHDTTTFNAIVDSNRGNPRDLMTGLFGYFESNPEGMFDGEHVSRTFQVSIEEEKQINHSAIVAELAFEIRKWTED